MRKKLLTIILLAFTCLNFSDIGNSEQEIRAQFYEASYEKISVEDYKKYLDNYEPKESPIYIGYESMYFMLISRKSWNPYSKYNNFLKGKEKLESAIKLSPKNIELIYLRFCIQRTLPNILNYSSDIETDKEFILSNWSTLTDFDLKNRIQIYFVDNGIVNEAYFNNNL